MNILDTIFLVVDKRITMQIEARALVDMHR